MNNPLPLAGYVSKMVLFSSLTRREWDENILREVYLTSLDLFFVWLFLALKRTQCISAETIHVERGRDMTYTSLRCSCLWNHFGTKGMGKVRSVVSGVIEYSGPCGNSVSCCSRSSPDGREEGMQQCGAWVLRKRFWGVVGDSGSPVEAETPRDLNDLQ